MARRTVNIFNVSFLDCIFCGFGAVVLLFVIINARALSERTEEASRREADTSRIEQEVREKRKYLILVKNMMEETNREAEYTRGLSSSIEKELEGKRGELSKYRGETLAGKQRANRLKADIRSLEEDYTRLKAAAIDADGGMNIKEFRGDGDRQYLTGVKLGGERILVLVDASASMLGKQIVDVIIRRNLSDDAKRQSPKWQRAVSTVDWITSRFPAGARFQLYAFNETARPVLPDTAGEWLDASNPAVLADAMGALRKAVPEKGTSLHAAVGAIGQLRPRPDNVFLLVDGLPTIGSRKPIQKKVSGSARLKHFRDAVRDLPRGLPFNVVLFPMEGDPMAATSYWRLAVQSRGSFFSPSEDWP